MFTVNDELIGKAREILLGRKQIYWIIGGSCSGKSTISRAISKTKSIPIYDMDEHVYGAYGAKITPERHPAMHAWFSASDSFAWIMSLSWEEFDALNRATNAEYLDLLTDDLSSGRVTQPLIVDGGFTHPSVLAQVVASHRIVCLETTGKESARLWETDESRAFMKEMVLNLPDPEAMWRKFLRFDKLMAQTMNRESGENRVKLLFREEGTAVSHLADLVVDYFGL
ncbi:MAG: hypothetical protein GY803_25645 [Chloroflexi bacterium]|nr:hypothetical protein [Chloroflexota bacterium]